MLMVNNLSGFGAYQAESGGGGDPYFANVVSLLHFDTGNTTITDVKGLTWTASGNASANGTAKFGAYALALDGSGDDVRTANSSVFNLDDKDWTIECWYFSVLGGSSRPAFTKTNSFSLHGNFLSGTLRMVPFVRFSDATNASFSAGTVPIAQNTWMHLCMMRSGNTLYNFVDGVLDATANCTGKNVATSTSSLVIGYNGSVYLNGRIDDFRFTVGAARYSTTGFTPPDAPFPDS